MSWHEGVAILSGLQAAVWLFSGVRHKAEAVHAGWSDQTTINLKICGYIGVAILGIATFAAALTMKQWLPPILQYFS